MSPSVQPEQQRKIEVSGINYEAVNAVYTETLCLMLENYTEDHERIPVGHESIDTVEKHVRESVENRGKCSSKISECAASILQDPSFLLCTRCKSCA